MYKSLKDFDVSEDKEMSLCGGGRREEFCFGKTGVLVHLAIDELGHLWSRSTSLISTLH